MMDGSEPNELSQSLKDKNYQKAMKEKLNHSINKSIGVKWVYKPNLRPNGDIAKYKAKLVANGFLQRHKINFNEVYALVSKLETIRIMVPIKTYKGWKLHQLYVKLSFPNGAKENEVYVKKP